MHGIRIYIYSITPNTSRMISETMSGDNSIIPISSSVVLDVNSTPLMVGLLVTSVS